MTPAHELPAKRAIEYLAENPEAIDQLARLTGEQRALLPEQGEPARTISTRGIEWSEYLIKAAENLQQGRENS